MGKISFTDYEWDEAYRETVEFDSGIEQLNLGTLLDITLYDNTELELLHDDFNRITMDKKNFQELINAMQVLCDKMVDRSK